MSKQSGPREKAGARVVGWLLLGLVVLGAAGYVAAYAAAGDNVPRGTTVSGVRLGGHPQDEAAERLRAGLADRVGAPIELSVDGTPVTVSAEEAGLSVDYEASVEEAGGERSWSPERLWRYFTGGEELDAVVEVDDTAFQALVQRLDAEHGSAPVEGAVTFRGTSVQTTDAADGSAVDPDQLLDALRGAFLSDDSAASVETVTVPPAIDAADVQAAVRDVANPAVSGPVTLSFDRERVTLAPREFVPALSMAARDGALVPQLDTAALAELVQSKVSTESAPVDATVALVNGRPKVVKGKPGVTFDQAQVDAGFLDVVVAPEGSRTLEVDAEVARPAFTTKDARALQVKERVSSFPTYYPHADYRNINIGRAAEIIDGTVLKPGETFSLNDTVGERTRENGFTEGFIISDGIFKEDLGGGVSQVATTLFNAMFFAGLEDVEHKPHSFYIDRYPVGREATVAWGAVDLRFRNDTPYGVLITTSLSPSSPGGTGSLTVSMWSTKIWDITERTGARYNLTQPDTRTLNTPDCYPNTGYGGFDIDVDRIFRKVGESAVDHVETFTTTYTPSDTVICKPPPREDEQD